ncbi:hypothetical protein [Campylobacter californiensis]|uniref:hypothetical protein n=1 Tax=Campylobacter californiensis TaxID=1032243 RepID=UPI001472707F|nr:hypothetical protein [Campylobacter sp. RM12916]MBE3610527.1 hypothetical protein [Campylobacter sp. RM12916]
MKKYTIYAFIVMFLTGCVFNPNNKDIGFFKGVPYYVPKETTKHTLVTEEIKKGFVENGISVCEIGDVFWVSQWDKYSFDRAIENKDIYAIKELFKEQLIGCTSPMSKEEFEYRMKAMQIQANSSNYGWQDVANSWANSMKSNAEYMRNMQNENTLNSINRNLQDINRNLNYGRSGGFYNPMPIYP